MHWGVPTFGGMEWWNGIVEWTTGMVECFIGHTYVIIQHVLYSEQWALCCVLCMHCWLDGWLARLVLHCMNFELWARPGYTFTLWCMPGNQAPQYVSHLITNCHFSIFHILYEYNQKVYPGYKHAGWLGMSCEVFHHSSRPFHYSIPFHRM